MHFAAGGQEMSIRIRAGLRLGRILSDGIFEGYSVDSGLDRHLEERRLVALYVVTQTY